MKQFICNKKTDKCSDFCTHSKPHKPNSSCRDSKNFFCGTTASFVSCSLVVKVESTPTPKLNPFFKAINNLARTVMLALLMFGCQTEPCQKLYDECMTQDYLNKAEYCDAYKRCMDLLPTNKPK